MIVAAGPRAEVLPLARRRVPGTTSPTATALAGLFNVHVHLAFDASREMLAHFLAGYSAGGRAFAAVVDAAQRRDDGAGPRRPRPPGAEVGRRSTGRPLRGCWCRARRSRCRTGTATSSAARCRPTPEIRALIDENAAAGADVIKVMASGGQITEGGADMWESQFAARAAFGGGFARGVARPAGGGARARRGRDRGRVEAGVSTVEHCSFLTGPRPFDRRSAVARGWLRAGFRRARRAAATGG